MNIGIINAAIQQCELSTYRVHIGAVLFKGKRIISVGHNAIRTSSISPKHKLFHNSLHAEQACLLNLDWTKLKGSSILVVKVSPTEKRLGMARPCPLCMKLLNFVGIKNIYYSNEDGEIIKEKTND